MSVDALATPADLAEVLRITEKQVHELRRKHRWPCVRLSHKAIRFTPEQVEAIVAQHSEAPQSAPALPRIEGQTARSRRRRSA